MIMKSSSAKSVGIWAAWHQRSSLAQPPGTGTVFRLSYCFPVQFCKNHDLSNQTPWFLSFLAVFFSVFLRVRHALSRGGFFSVFLHFLLTGTWPKSCLGVLNVSFERIFQNDVKISLSKFQDAVTKVFFV